MKLERKRESMATVIRPEVSDRNQYWISKHRYYELKHFCLQYPGWKKNYKEADGYCTRSASLTEARDKRVINDPTAMFAESRIYFADRIAMVDQAAKEAADSLSTYVLKSVTEGASYEKINALYKLPCGKDTWYAIYRRFFWLLSKARN